MERLNFFTPVKYPQPLLEAIDGFFYFGNKRAEIISGKIVNGSQEVVIKPIHEPLTKRLIVVALKVALCLTGVFPLLIFTAKVLFRMTHRFHIAPRVNSQIPAPVSPSISPTPITPNQPREFPPAITPREKLPDGVVEEVRVERDGTKVGKRRFPDGTLEEGRFLYGKELTQGYRKKGDAYTFYRPELINTHHFEESNCLGFAEVEIEGKKRLFAVEGVFGDQFVPYPNPVEMLVKLALDPAHDGVIKKVFDHPDNSIDPKAFLDRLLAPSEVLKGSCPLLHLNGYKTQQCLQLAKEHRIQIDAAVGQSLFRRCAGTGNFKLTQLVLELSPEAILEPRKGHKSYYTSALLHGYKDEAEVLLNAMQAKGVQLSPQEAWVKRAKENDATFSDQEFRALPPETQRYAYRAANLYGHEGLVGRLNGLGMEPQNATIEAPSVLGPKMDLLSSKTAIAGFFTKLRAQRLLLKEQEFQAITGGNTSGYVSKGDQLGRILGRDYFEQTAQKLGCKVVKVPRKIAVLEGESITVTVDKDTLELRSKNLSVYAERVHAAHRLLERQEMEELVRVLEATSMSDIHPDQFIIAQDGVYCIDTEFSNFYYDETPRYGSMLFLRGMVAEGDRKWFDELIEGKKSAYEAKLAASNVKQEDLWKTRSRELKRVGFKHRRPALKFDAKQFAL